MADEPVLHGLLRKRATMAGEIEALRAQLGELLTGLDHIDSTIRIFKPDIGLDDLPERAPPPPNAAFRGEVQRFLLDVLRAATEPLTTFDLARKIMDARRLNHADRILFKLIATRTGHSLGRLRLRGHVISERTSPGAMLRWRLNPDAPGFVAGWRNGSAAGREA
jgi:hypothetical protein